VRLGAGLRSAGPAPRSRPPASWPGVLADHGHGRRTLSASHGHHTPASRVTAAVSAANPRSWRSRRAGPLPRRRRPGRLSGAGLGGGGGCWGGRGGLPGRDGREVAAGQANRGATPRRAVW